MSKSDAACRKIRAAATESQVVAAVREYLGSLGPADALGVPVHAVSSCLVHTEESIHSALQVFEDALAALQGDSANPDAAEGMRLVLTAAARRIATLNGKKD